LGPNIWAGKNFIPQRRLKKVPQKNLPPKEGGGSKTPSWGPLKKNLPRPPKLFSYKKWKEKVLNSGG